MPDKQSKTKVDPNTGEIYVPRVTSARTIAIPKKETITPLSKIAGENPPALNLRDNRDFFNGKEIIIMEAKFRESTVDGKLSSFVIMAGFVYVPGTEPKQEDFKIIMTGSENVQGRLAEAEMAAGEGSPYPIVARFRCAQGGRAWFLD